MKTTRCARFFRLIYTSHFVQPTYRLGTLYNEELSEGRWKCCRKKAENYIIRNVSVVIVKFKQPSRKAPLTRVFILLIFSVGCDALPKRVERTLCTDLVNKFQNDIFLFFGTNLFFPASAQPCRGKVPSQRPFTLHRSSSRVNS